MSDARSSSAIAVVPAAGASRRFGGVKLVADVAGEPLLQRTLRCLLEAGLERVLVVVSADRESLLRAAVPLLDEPRVCVVVNPEPDRGMFSSIQTGLAAIDRSAPVLVLPADMPFVRAETVFALLSAHEHDRAAVSVASYAGKRGHPIVLPADVRARLVAQPPSTSLKDALLEMGVPWQEVPVDDPGVLRDVDVRQDLP